MSTCQNCKKDFSIEAEDFEYYKKISAPPPTFCPECRLIRRFMWRNERFLYKRPCGLCKKEGLSCFAPESPYTAYCPKCWWSDDWDSMQYGAEYDFSKPFFEQFQKLMNRTPLLGLWVTTSTLVNSDYSNLAAHLRNCYMVFHADNNEDCSYASGLKYSKNSMDVTMLQHSESCYECLNVQKGYENFFSIDCENCRKIYFSKDCVECNDCIGCIGLRKKKYHIFNEPYSKEEYEQKLKEFDFGSRAAIEDFKKKVEAFWLTRPVKYLHGRYNVNSSGDYVFNTKNAKFCYETFNAQDCKYVQNASLGPTTDCYDYTEWGWGADQIYEAVLCGEGVAQLKFVVNSTGNTRACEYSMTAISSTNLFGCVSLKKKEYCILNRQYTKEEYEALIPKIKKHMDTMPYVGSNERVYKYGEFFPLEIAPYRYNEGTAQEFFPLDKVSAPVKGYSWLEVGDKPYTPTISWSDLPDTIAKVKDEILNEIILCKAWDEDVERAKLHGCTKAFRLTPQELQFYRRYNLPVPTRCHNTRHFERTKVRAPIRYWHRQCANCSNEFETSYAPDRHEIVYCEQCYQQETV